uniref:Arf-GAP domain-containing protein n=1 Tax=Trichobilharzia regenti TaxID=157069 RepID=A0AA85K905_TRIRE|nr:unnamed protein product [Trichobilharzia regenti]
MQDPTLQFLRALVTHGENRYCFDCHQRGPTYVNITIGSFVCTTCSGALRKYNHRVKSISMSNFSQSEIDFLCTRGNKACRKIYLALSDDQTMTEKDLKDSALDNFLRQKYQLQKWYRDPTPQIEAEALKENRELLEQAEKNMNQKSNRTTCGNAAAGLIVLPTRVNANASQVNSTGGTSQSSGTSSINGENTAPQQSVSNHVVSSQKQDAFTSQAKINTDPFASFTPNFPSTANSSAVGKEDLFGNFPPKVTTSTTNVNMMMMTQPFPSVNSTMPSSSMFTHSSVNTTNNFYGSNSSSGDKYAALAELDGLFKNSGISSSTSETAVEKTVNDVTVSKTNIPIVNTSHWATSFTPQISYPNNTVVGTHGWPTSTPFQDTTHTLNPFANSSLGVQNSIGFNRIPNPFTSYPIVAASPNISQFGEPVSLPKSDSKNPFLPITQQSFSVNPFSNLTNPPSISYPQSTMNSFSPMIMHSVNSFPTKMDTPVNGMVGGQLGSSGFLDNNNNNNTNNNNGETSRPPQMSNFNPF